MKRRDSTGELFGAGPATDPVFDNLCKSVHECASKAKCFAERLWAVYQPHADPHFLTEIRSDFSARFWEMYLTCALLERAAERGYSVTCPKPGPDILLELNRGRIWIEAVTPTNGQPGKPDSLVEPGFPAMWVGDSAGKPEGMDRPIEETVAESGRIPEEKIVLRYTTAIREKYQKYLCYLREGYVHKNDAYVIAVNRSRLAYRWASADIDRPRFLKAVYPIGELELLIDREAGKIVGARNRPRFFVCKANKSPVSVQSFVLGRRRGLSAVLCSDADMGWWSSPLGSDFELAHNPLCRQPIPRGVIPAAREWRAELYGAEGMLFCDPERS